MRVFVGGPFTAALSPTAEFHEETQLRLKSLLTIVRRVADSHFSSHETESWGENLEEPSALFRRDLRELKGCSHLVVYVSDVHSFGATFEMGYAICLGRPVFVVYEPESRPRSDFYRGLVECGSIQECEWIDDSEVEEEVGRFIRR